MNATLLLADYAVVSDGKLTIVGGGWSWRTVDPAPSAVAVHVQVPWDQANVDHNLRLELLDADGQPVLDPEDKPIALPQSFQVGRPPGLKPGSQLDHFLALVLGPLPLQAGSRYEWRLTINDETRDEWRRPFSVVPRPPQQVAA